MSSNVHRSPPQPRGSKRGKQKGRQGGSHLPNRKEKTIKTNHEGRIDAPSTPKPSSFPPSSGLLRPSLLHGHAKMNRLPYAGGVKLRHRRAALGQGSSPPTLGVPNAWLSLRVYLKIGPEAGWARFRCENRK